MWRCRRVLRQRRHARSERQDATTLQKRATLIRDTLIHDDSSDHTLHSRNKWILPEVVLDPCFWRWALCVARASFSSFDTLDANWRKMNAAAQAAVFDAARDEWLRARPTRAPTAGCR